MELRVVIIINKQEIVKNSNYKGNPDYEVKGKRKKSKAKEKKKQNKKNNEKKKKKNKKLT